MTPSLDILARLESFATARSSPRSLSGILVASIVGGSLLGGSLLGGCTGTDPQSTSIPTIDAGSAITVLPDDSRTTDDTTDPLAFPAYGDPDAPIFVAVGHHFALMLEADPTSGFHWTAVRPFDKAIVAPLGTQFMTSDTAVNGTSDSEILSFVATGEGTSEIVLRYSSNGNRSDGGQSDDGVREVTFTVTVTSDGKPPPDVDDTIPSQSN